MPDENLLIAYAFSFASYLFKELKKSVLINKIILFGSVAKRISEKGSDIDIFIDLLKKTNSFEKEINEKIEQFYKSREGLLFKTKGINNKINVIVGKLDNWKELKKSIESSGIVIYGNYVASNVKGKKYAIIFWSSIKKNRGAFLNKLYGFNSGEVHYQGLLDNFEGRKLGKSCVMVPVEYVFQIEPLLKHYGVDAKIVEVYS